MRLQRSFAWALAGTAVLAFVLLLFCHPAAQIDAGTGMSAPLPVKASIEFAPAVRFSHSQIDPHSFTLRTQNVSLPLAALESARESRNDVNPPAPHYGPLHRRPPPVFVFVG